MSISAARAQARPRPLSRRRWGALAVTLSTLAASAPAAAYVRARTEITNVVEYWPNPHVLLEVSRPPEVFSIPADGVRAAVAGALAAWSYPAIDCTTLSLSLVPGFAEGQKVAFDGHNRVIVRTGLWWPDPDNPSHDASQVALTTVFTRTLRGSWDDGQILEADIEINDAGYDWAVIPDGEISGRDYANSYDLQSALTHEVGHFVGLAHNCLLSSRELPAVDDEGRPSPSCDAVPSEVADQIFDGTMFARMRTADVNWRTLSGDETKAACDLYARQGAPMVGWCAVAPPTRGEQTSFSLAGLLASGVAVVFALAWRRRRSPSSRSPSSRTIH